MQTQDNHIGQTVRFRRCGAVQSATIIGWDYVSGPRGSIRGDALSDPRYAAKSPGGITVAVCASEIVR
jgi:hypothetical protein